MLYPIDWSGVKSTQDVLNQVSGLIFKYQFSPGEWLHFASRGENTPEGVKIMTEGLTLLQTGISAARIRMVLLGE